MVSFSFLIFPCGEVVRELIVIDYRPELRRGVQHVHDPVQRRQGLDDGGYQENQADVCEAVRALLLGLHDHPGERHARTNTLKALSLASAIINSQDICQQRGTQLPREAREGSRYRSIAIVARFSQRSLSMASV